MIEKKRTKEIIPLDETLGIAGSPFKISKNMMSELAFWGQQESSYERAEYVLKEKLQIPVTAMTIKRVTDYVGQQVFEADSKRADEMEQQMATLPCEQTKAEKVYVMMDGSAVNTRTTDENGSSWRENKLAVIFKEGDVKVRKDGKSKDIKKKRYVSYTGCVEEFGKHLFAEAMRYGCFKHKEIVIVSDGAAWIRKLSEDVFPGATHILDFYHLAEHIYSYAKIKFNNEEEKYTEWAEHILTLLKEGNKSAALELLKECEGKKLGEGMVNPYTYLKHNEDKTDYADYLRRGLYIGSGPIESANKTVVQKRCKQAGMRWNVPTVQTMLTLRAKYESSLWQTDVADFTLAA